MCDAHPLPAENEGRRRVGIDRFKTLSIDTRLGLSKSVVPKSVNPLTMPIYHTATYVFDSIEQYTSPRFGGNYIYQRCGNPTQETAESMICELEQGAGTLVYNSGLAAINAVFLRFLSSGDHLVCQNPLYSGTHSFVTETLTRFGVRVTWVDAIEADFLHSVEHALTDDTKMIYVETPCNPVLTVVDIDGLCRIGANHNILIAVDTTFASPYLQQPIASGVDFAIHSCSKYIGGHSDLVGGCVTTKTLEQWRQLKIHQMTTGSTMSPFDASLVIRGLKTLPLRVMRASESALIVAQFLETHKKVVRVWYAGLESHPNHAVACKQMRHFGGMLAFDVGTRDAAIDLVRAVRIITLAVSLGGTESLIEHPGTMTHGKHLGQNFNLPPGMLRLSVGLESVDDIIGDLQHALDQI